MIYPHCHQNLQHTKQQRSNETHLVFAGELSPYSNMHKSPFIINGQQFHSSEQWIQYQKALAFGDSYTANLILQSDSALDCKWLSYKIKGVDTENGTMKDMILVWMESEKNLFKIHHFLHYSRLHHLKFLLKLHWIIYGALGLQSEILVHLTRTNGAQQVGCLKCY